MPPLNRVSKTALAVAISQAILQPALGATLTVNTSSDDSVNDGVCTLREAIVSVNTQTANAECGTSVPDGDDTIVFAPSNLLSAGDTISLTQGQLNPRESVSIEVPNTLNGLAVTNTSGRVFGIYSENDPIVEISNLTITGGTAGFGAGFFVTYGAELTLNDCTVSSNTATTYGGGGIVAYLGSLVTLNNSTVTANVAPSYGGGISVADNSSLTINGGFVSNNTATGVGGGLDARNSSSITLSGVSVQNNSATISGGGISVTDSVLNTQNFTFIFVNTANGTNFNHGGGGISVRGASVVTANETGIFGNQSGNDGGGLDAFQTARISLNRSTLTNNSAARYGGGAYIADQATLSMSNSTVARNRAGRGAGLFANNGGTVSISHATVTENSAVNQAGGVVAEFNGAVAKLNNSIVSGNLSPVMTGKELLQNTGSSFEITGVNVLGSDELTSNEAFVGVMPAQSNIIATSDGNTPTYLADIVSPLALIGEPLAANLLPSGSPAIGNAKLADCPNNDQRGKPRDTSFIVPIVAANNNIAVADLGGECDIGAIEFTQGDP